MHGITSLSQFGRRMRALADGGEDADESSMTESRMLPMTEEAG